MDSKKISEALGMKEFDRSEIKKIHETLLDHMSMDEFEGRVDDAIDLLTRWSNQIKEENADYEDYSLRFYDSGAMATVKTAGYYHNEHNTSLSLGIYGYKKTIVKEPELTEEEKDVISQRKKATLRDMIKENPAEAKKILMEIS